MSNYNIVKTNDLNTTKINNTEECGGRFGNIFIRNFVAEYIAKKNNLKINYERYEQFKKLGITLFIGENNYDETLIITDDIIDSLIFDDNIFNKYALNKNILFKDYTYCQTSSIVSYIRNVVNFENRVCDSNPYKLRYENNNDIFIHVRLGDIIDLNFNVSYEYYDNILNKIYNSENNSYITSDSINHEICQKLINKYNLKIYNSNEIDTIQFGSTCKNIILSNGTYSWLIGLLGFKSNIYYPTIKTKWHGNIYIYPDWNKIDW